MLIMIDGRRSIQAAFDARRTPGFDELLRTPARGSLIYFFFDICKLIIRLEY